MMSKEIDQLSASLARLPGLGPRSARRAVLWLVKNRESALPNLLESLAIVSETLVECQICGNVDTTDPCQICADPRRDQKSLCVVEDVADVWALDRGKLFRGRYHVLGGKLSALDGVGPDDLNIASLLERVSEGQTDEVVLAMNATLEGQTTAHYLAERLEPLGVRITQLAHGLPVGGELDYLDEGTLAQALRARRPVG
ncbi:MAG: recombination mediator RecR [Pseudomonadota bacterium]